MKLHTPLLALAAMLATASVHAADMDWSSVDQAFGKKGAAQAGGVYRVTFPRTDLQVSLDGVALKPGFALGTHVEFMPMGNQAMVMGDLVLTEDEVSPVMLKIEQAGIQITALHNHLLRSQPSTLYMHVMGEGDAVKLAVYPPETAWSD